MRLSTNDFNGRSQTTQLNTFELSDHNRRGSVDVDRASDFRLQTSAYAWVCMNVI